MNLEQLKHCLGKRIRVTNADRDSLAGCWEGDLLALSDSPALLLKLDNGDRVMLPQSFTIERVQTEPTGLGAVVIDDKLRRFVHAPGSGDGQWWCTEGGERGWYTWRELLENHSPVTVLSEGVEAS